MSRSTALSTARIPVSAVVPIATGIALLACIAAALTGSLRAGHVDAVSVDLRSEAERHSVCLSAADTVGLPLLDAMGAGDVRIECVPQITPPEGDEGYIYYGFSHEAERIIEVSYAPGIDPAQVRSTTAHEVAHMAVSTHPRLRAEIVRVGGIGAYRGPEYRTSPAEAFAQGVAVSYVPDAPEGLVVPWSAERVAAVLRAANVSMS